MTYDSHHTPVYDPAQGYNLIAKEYKQYHQHLDSFEKWIFQKFIPRDTENARIIDLGAGDWRIYKYFKNFPHKTYTACDIAEKLLDEHPGNVHKIICDLNNTLPCQDKWYTIATSFFVIEYIQNTEAFFNEVYRILDAWWRYILWYFLQKRLFTHRVDNKEFRIKQYTHDPDTIDTELESCWFSVYREEVREKDTLLWYIRVAEK